MHKKSWFFYHYINHAWISFNLKDNLHINILMLHAWITFEGKKYNINNVEQSINKIFTSFFSILQIVLINHQNLHLHHQLKLILVGQVRCCLVLGAGQENCLLVYNLALWRKKKLFCIQVVTCNLHVLLRWEKVYV